MLYFFIRTILPKLRMKSDGINYVHVHRTYFAQQRHAKTLFVLLVFFWKNKIRRRFLNTKFLRFAWLEAVYNQMYHDWIECLIEWIDKTLANDKSVTERYGTNLTNCLSRHLLIHKTNMHIKCDFNKQSCVLHLLFTYHIFSDFECSKNFSNVVNCFLSHLLLAAAKLTTA